MCVKMEGRGNVCEDGGEGECVLRWRGGDW